MPAQLVAHERLDDREPGPRDDGADTRAVVGDREHDLAVPPRELDPDAIAAVLERVLQQLGEDQCERRRAGARQRDRLELRRHLLAAADTLDEHRPQPVDQVGELDVLVAPLGEQLVHGGDRQDPIHRVLERLARVDRVRGPRLQTKQRRDRLQVVLHAMVDLLREHASQHRPPVLERDGGVRRDRREQLAVELGERPVAIGDQLADLTPAPAQRLADRMGRRNALRPGDPAVVQHERGAGRVRGRPSSS